VSPLSAARVRYGVPRRGTGIENISEDVARTFALPGTWTFLDPGSVDIDAATGELTLPCHPLGLGFNEIEVTYNAGVDRAREQPGSNPLRILRRHAAGPGRTQISGALRRAEDDLTQVPYESIR